MPDKKEQHNQKWAKELNRHFSNETYQFSSVQSLSRVRLCDPMNRSKILYDPPPRLMEMKTKNKQIETS